MYIIIIIINAEWYINACLCTRSLQLHHNNAHTATATLEYLEENHVQLVAHTQYSTDLALCDFFVSSSEVAVEREVSGHQRCFSLHCGCGFWSETFGVILATEYSGFPRCKSKLTEVFHFSVYLLTF